MGFYLNPGNKGFWEFIRPKIYVDKTDLIACTNELIKRAEIHLRQQTAAVWKIHGVENACCVLQSWM